MGTFISELEDHQKVMADLAVCADVVTQAGKQLLEIFNSGGKLLLCGNGGSAADCQHIAAEFVVRYVKHRKGLPAIALTTDSSILTAHSNDYDFASVFARQVDAIGRAGDCLIAISTSGTSANIVNAAKMAQAKGMTVIAMMGANKAELSQHADLSVQVPSTVTARIQEAHILIGHWWCDFIETQLSGDA